MLKRTVIATATALAAGLLLSAPATAQPGDNPCELAINFLCRFVPIAPDLDHDIDLTQQQPVDPGQQRPQAFRGLANLSKLPIDLIDAEGEVPLDRAADAS